jgi:hypothetical protein
VCTSALHLLRHSLGAKPSEAEKGSRKPGSCLQGLSSTTKERRRYWVLEVSGSGGWRGSRGHPRGVSPLPPVPGFVTIVQLHAHRDSFLHLTARES